MEHLVGTTFIKSDDSKEAKDSVDLKVTPVDNTFLEECRVTCIYFCAKWCPPCQVFTPILKEFYEDINCEKKQLEIIWVSADKDQASFNDYLKEMPWIAIPFGDKRIKEILDHFRLERIPALYVIKPTGECVSTTGREDVLHEGAECFVKWDLLVKGKSLDKLKRK